MSEPTNSKLVLKVLSNKSQTQLNDDLIQDPSLPEEFSKGVMNFLQGCAGGMQSAELQVQDGSDSANGTFTVASSGAQTLTIAGVALTGGTSYTIANLAASAIAQNIADAINDSVNTSVQLVGATVSGADVTVTSLNPGLVGNYIPISATGAVSASGATLANGTAGTLNVYQYGLR